MSKYKKELESLIESAVSEALINESHPLCVGDLSDDFRCFIESAVDGISEADYPYTHQQIDIIFDSELLELCDEPIELGMVENAREAILRESNEVIRQVSDSIKGDIIHRLRVAFDRFADTCLNNGAPSDAKMILSSGSNLGYFAHYAETIEGICIYKGIEGGEVDGCEFETCDLVMRATW